MCKTEEVIMDNKIVSTTYVPLQPPFQIIKYSGDIAMQIGTLIVTIQKEGNVNGLGYQIETHSHPVVSYENKFKTDPNKQLAAYHFLEGAVWNNVEVKDVTTICLTNARLPWREFIDFLWRDVDRRLSVALPTIAAFWPLDKLCGGVEPPKSEHYTVYLDILNYTKIQGQNIPVVRSRAGDIFALNAEATNEDEMIRTIRYEIANYIMVLRNCQRPTSELKITYETDNPECEHLVEILNLSNVFREPLNPLVDTTMDLIKAMQGKI